MQNVETNLQMHNIRTCTDKHVHDLRSLHRNVKEPQEKIVIIFEKKS